MQPKAPYSYPTQRPILLVSSFCHFMVLLPLSFAAVKLVLRQPQAWYYVPANQKSCPIHPRIQVSLRSWNVQSGHVTRNMLTIPLRAGTDNRVVGVAQFLNKTGDEGFTEDDERTAIVATATIAMKADELMRDPENLESLGFHVSSDAQEATLLFCDLSASAVLFQVLDAPGAINCIDEYLTRHTDVALRHGAILDKYLGDGAMFRFNAFLEAGSLDHTVRAAEAALEMRPEFRGS